MSDELDTKTVAGLLNVDPRSVLYAVERGELPATSIRRGKKRFWRFLRSDVEAYLQSTREQPQGRSSDS